MKLIWIDLGYATFGIILNEQGIVYKAAPIANWMICKHINEINVWLKKKNAKVVVINITEDNGK